MSKSNVWRIMMSLMAAVLVLSSFAGAVSAAALDAPVAQELRAQEVKGTIPGGQSAEIWLGLETVTSGENITVMSTWDRIDPTSNGVGFYILTDENTTDVLNGTDPRLANLATGSALAPDSPENEVGAIVRATSDFFTLIVYNNSTSDANFTLTAENAFITDGSGQVEDAAMSDDETMDEDMADADAEDAESDTATPADEAEPAADDTAADDTATADTATEDTANEETAADDATAEDIDATEAAETDEVDAADSTSVVVTPGVIEAQELEGELPTQGDKHFLGLEPSDRDGTMNLVMTFDPRDSSELSTRIGFWVLDQNAFNRYLNPSENVVLSEVAVAAGSGNQPDLADNERSATLTASGFGPYTVVPYNDSNVPAEYTLRVDGGLLRDDSGQTETAKMAVSGSATMTGTVDADAIVVEEDATPAEGDDEAATTEPTREGEPGGTYTVQSGDTLSLIARDIYGSVGLWEDLCSFNNLSDCNILEVGDTIQLPTEDQLGTGATAPAAAAETTAPATEATDAAADEAEDEETAPAADVDATDTVTATESVTDTADVDATSSVTDTTEAETEADTEAATPDVDLLTLLEAQGGMTILVDALEAASLDDTLMRDPGPFTIFAPTDAAFEATLPNYEDLFANPAGTLTQLLLYHVVSDSELMSSDITDGTQATTAHQGLPVQFEVTDDGLKVQDSLITTADLEASNGVIHIIDKVMIPSDIQ